MSLPTIRPSESFSADYSSDAVSTFAIARSSDRHMDLYTLRDRRCGPWDWSRDLRGQEGFAEHAASQMWAPKINATSGRCPDGRGSVSSRVPAAGRLDTGWDDRRLVGSRLATSAKNTKLMPTMNMPSSLACAASAAW